MMGRPKKTSNDIWNNIEKKEIIQNEQKEQIKEEKNDIEKEMDIKQEEPIKEDKPIEPPKITIEEKPKEKKLLGGLISIEGMSFGNKENANPEYMPNIPTEKDKPQEGISGKIDSINSKLDKIMNPEMKKVIKQFKMPSKIGRQLKKIAGKGKVLVILLNTNKSITPIITDIIDGFISINGVPHNCSMDFVYLWKGKYPCIVLNEWDLNPIGTKDYYDAVKEKRVAPPIAVVLRMIKSGEKLIGKDKMQFNSVWIWIGIAAIAIIYLFIKKP